jgi:MFS family permease
MAYLNNTLVCVAWALLYRYADFITLLGGTELHLGWVVGVGWIGSVSMRFSLGSRIDQHGPRRIWLGSLILFTISCFAHLAVTRCDGPAIYLLRILLCTATAGVFGASTMFVTGRVSGPRLAELIGMLGTSGFLGMMIGTHLGDLLCGSTPSHDGAMRMFLVAGLIGSAAIPFAWMATRGLRPPAPRRSLPITWLVTRYHPGMILVVGIVTGAALTLPATFLRTYAADLEIPRIGLFFTVAAITALCTRLVIRRLPERFGLAPLILLGLGAMVLAQLLFLTVRAEWQLIVPGLAHGVAQAILYPLITAAGSSTFPGRHRGLGTTVMLATLDVGQLVGAPAAGLILHGSEALGLASYPTLFTAMAAMLVLAAVSYGISLCRRAVPDGPAVGLRSRLRSRLRLAGKVAPAGLSGRARPAPAGTACPEPTVVAAPEAAAPAAARARRLGSGPGPRTTPRPAAGSGRSTAAARR